MREAQEKTPAKGGGHAERDRTERMPAAVESPVFAARGLSFDGMGNRALLSLLRSGQLQRKARTGQPGVAAEGRADRKADVATLAAPAPRIDRILGDPGKPLAPPMRLDMEQRFGHDFSQVRIHTDTKAADSARAVQAQAYTVGRDVVFAEGHYQPHSREGSRLLAHELAHVIQQQRGGASPDPLNNEMLEHAADAAASAFAAGCRSIHTAGASAPGLARQPLPGALSLSDEKPRSLTGSLLKDEQRLDNAALDQEVTLIRKWLEAHPFGPENDHLESELQALQLEQLSRTKRPAKSKQKVPTTASNPPTARLTSYEASMFQKIIDARNCSVDDKGFMALLQQSGLYSYYLAHRFQFNPLFAPVFKLYTPEEPEFWANKIPQDLARPIKIAAETSFVEQWKSETIEGVGDQGDKHIQVETSFWRMTRPAFRAYIAHMGGSLTPFEEKLVQSEEIESEEITPIIRGEKIVAYYLLSGGSGDRHHTVYARDGTVINFWQSETALVNEGIGPLVLALPGVGLRSMGRDAINLGKAGLTASRQLAAKLGLDTALRKAAVTTKLMIGTAEAGAAVGAPTALGGIASRTSVTLVEGRAATAVAQQAAHATVRAEADTAATVRAVQSTPAAGARTVLPPSAPTVTQSVTNLGTRAAGASAATQAEQSEAMQRVQLIERMEQIVRESARIYDDALARGDASTLGEFLYPSEVNYVLRGGNLAAARRGVFVEWRSRYMFARDPLIQQNIGRGGYLGERYVVGKGFRRGFADFSGTSEGLLSGLFIDITTEGALAKHLARGYLEKGLILTY